MSRLNTALPRFFGLSLAVHALVFSYFFLVNQLKSGPRGQPPPIAVSLLPPGEKAAKIGEPPAATRSTKTPATIGKSETAPRLREDTKLAREKAQAALRTPNSNAEKTATAKEKNLAAERKLDDQIAGLPVPIPRELPVEKSTAGERQLPTVKELLPPITYSSGGGRGTAPVSLNTKDPAYISYFNRIKQAIEQNWEYPELALRYGLQGRLSLEFAVNANGQLEHVRIVRSSGSQLLDDEAQRAIKAAAPFPPIPPWIKGTPLSISASMEYYDNRLNYRYLR